MTIEPVTPWRRVPLADGNERIVALDEAGKIVHVAVMAPHSELATSEISFELSQAFDLATACLAGNSRAMTTPGLTRLLCASVLVLGVAAFKAGGLLKQAEFSDGSATEPDDQDRDETGGDGPDD